MIQKKIGLISIVLFLIIAGAATALKSVTAQVRDKIEYNAV